MKKGLKKRCSGKEKAERKAPIVSGKKEEMGRGEERESSTATNREPREKERDGDKGRRRELY